MRIIASPAFSNEKVNPYNALLYRNMRADTAQVAEYSHKKALTEKFDIAHFHWPDGYMNQPSLLKSLQRIGLFAFVLLVLKFKGTKIVWTVHNIAPHDAYRPKLSQLFMNWFIQRCDGFIFMSEENKRGFYNRYTAPEGSQFAIIPHGHYRNSYAAPINQDEAKTILDIPPNKRVLLFFGMIKPYKNIDSLMRVFRSANIEDFVLLIAGNPDTPQLRQELEALGSNQHNIKMLLKFIPDDELHIYLSAADIVVLPYKAILNSGALLLALSFNKPVIAPHMGAIVSFQKELGAHWVYSYQDELDSDSLRTALVALADPPRNAICPLENYDWDRLAAATVSFYAQLLHTSSNYLLRKKSSL